MHTYMHTYGKWLWWDFEPCVFCLVVEA
jgi:hypothetical protein